MSSVGRADIRIVAHLMMFLLYFLPVTNFHDMSLKKIVL